MLHTAAVVRFASEPPTLLRRNRKTAAREPETRSGAQNQTAGTMIESGSSATHPKTKVRGVWAIRLHFTLARSPCSRLAIATPAAEWQARDEQRLGHDARACTACQCLCHRQPRRVTAQDNFGVMRTAGPPTRSLTEEYWWRKGIRHTAGGCRRSKHEAQLARPAPTCGRTGESEVSFGKNIVPRVETQGQWT